MINRHRPAPPTAGETSSAPRLEELFDLRATAWMTGAACAGVDLDFVPDGGDRAEQAVLELAEPVCGSCPVHAACLDYALADKSLLGIWASTTTRMRKRARRSAPAA